MNLGDAKPLDCRGGQRLLEVRQQSLCLVNMHTCEPSLTRHVNTPSRSAQLQLQRLELSPKFCQCWQHLSLQQRGGFYRRCALKINVTHPCSQVFGLHPQGPGLGMQILQRVFFE
jgi:hypothetical protein